MAGDLRRSARPPFRRAPEQDLRPLRVQSSPARLGQLTVSRLAQQRMAESDAPLALHEHPAVERLHGGLRRVLDRQRHDLRVLELARGNRRQLDEAPARVAERSERAAHRAAHPLRELPLTAGDRAGRLDRQQSVALRCCHHAGHVLLSQRRHVEGYLGDGRGLQGGEHELLAQ